jgi:acetoacetyl-CoA synthetase
MMWNHTVSALATGATVLLYDGSPLLRGGRALFEYVAAERASHCGVSAKFIDAIAKAGLQPRAEFALEHLRVVLSTGSPLSAEGFDYVYSAIKQDVQLASISGGTDICSCFVLGNPTAPVYRGEIQCRGLGMAVEVYDELGKPVRETKGELVCTRPFPAMPLGFWNDADARRYRAAYFARFPNVWCHGDYCELTASGGMLIYGRSDAVLNPGGVRIGTAEIYRQVEQLPEILESIAVGQEWQGDTRVILFVRLAPDVRLDDALREKIKSQIRCNTTPRHVPAKILEVSDIPRTKSGKIVEIAVRETIHGRLVKNQEALANAAALVEFRARPELLEP